MKIPGEIVRIIPHRVETRPGIPPTGGAGVDVAAQRVVTVEIALHALQSRTRRIALYA